MNTNRSAIGGAIIAVIVAISVAACSVSPGPSGGVEPSPSPVAEATPVPTVAPTAKATPTPTPEASASPVPTAKASPTPIPAEDASVVSSTVVLPKLTPKVAGATAVKYFSIKGESPAALLDDTVLRSNESCKSADTLACVFPRWDVRWTDSTRVATGACTIVAPKVTLKSTVYLPQWVGPKGVQPALVAWWKKMVDHMAWHEAQHIKIQKSFDSKLKPLMVGHKCSTANKIIDKWERSVKAAQQAFDAKDALWPYPEYTGPGGFFGTA